MAVICNISARNKMIILCIVTRDLVKNALSAETKVLSSILGNILSVCWFTCMVMQLQQGDKTITLVMVLQYHKCNLMIALNSSNNNYKVVNFHSNYKTYLLKPLIISNEMLSSRTLL